jgi:predicted phosphodiesterase
MRVAVLADIHGNLPALEAVLRDVHAAGVDAIVLNGDLADGPMPAQTLDRLEELGDPGGLDAGQQRPLAR